MVRLNNRLKHGIPNFGKQVNSDKNPRKRIPLMNSKPFCPNEMFISPTWIRLNFRWGVPPPPFSAYLFGRVWVFCVFGGYRANLTRRFVSLHLGWFQLLWKLWSRQNGWKSSPISGVNIPKLFEVSPPRIFMQFLPMAFRPLAIHLYHFCSLPLQVRMMWWPPWKWQEPQAMLGCYTVFNCGNLVDILENHRQSQVKINKDLFLKSNTCFEYKEICRLKKYREIYRTFSTKTLNGAMHNSADSTNFIRFQGSLVKRDVDWWLSRRISQI